MTQINYEEEHRKLWTWLADHPYAVKAQYFIGWDEPSIPAQECFACAYTQTLALVPGPGWHCQYCPLDRSVIGCHTEEGLYIQWRRTKSPEIRRELALKIANLPWDGKEKEND
jgi:hypothetical protein